MKRWTGTPRATVASQNREALFVEFVGEAASLNPRATNGARRSRRFRLDVHVAVSRSSNARLRATPQRDPERALSFRTTRWQGIATAMAFAAQAWATARNDFGAPIRFAMSA